MRTVNVGILVALLCLGMAGTASACGDPVAEALCMANDTLFGPNGVVPFGTHAVAEVSAIVWDILPMIHIPLGGFL